MVHHLLSQGVALGYRIPAPSGLTDHGNGIEGQAMKDTRRI
jgi:hypothetical protein